MPEPVRQLDADALALFARKGKELGPGGVQIGEANGVKVRRIMQITRDLVQRPFNRLRILDVGCGEGVYAIEAGLRGAEVLALDARTQRMEAGAACAARHGLKNVTFRKADVRQVRREKYGEFDVVYFLGLLYHLDVPDVFRVLENVYELCSAMLVLDTHISLDAQLVVTDRDGVYGGKRLREHADKDSAEVRRSHALRSIDNTFCFHFTRASLVRLLHDIGFSSVFECHAPPEPLKPENRVTMAALKRERVSIATYPWVNGLSELEIAHRLHSL
jgi:2-polyprenyl-3-methyl-5-hydroxy-6-metoxy-1,4-benzoquinol methylase